MRNRTKLWPKIFKLGLATPTTRLKVGYLEESLDVYQNIIYLEKKAHDTFSELKVPPRL